MTTNTNIDRLKARIASLEKEVVMLRNRAEEAYHEGYQSGLEEAEQKAEAKAAFIAKELARFDNLNKSTKLSSKKSTIVKKSAGRKKASKNKAAQGKKMTAKKPSATTAKATKAKVKSFSMGRRGRPAKAKQSETVITDNRPTPMEESIATYPNTEQTSTNNNIYQPKSEESLV